MVPNGALSYKLTWKIRTPLVGPKVSIIHRFHCIPFQCTLRKNIPSMHFFKKCAFGGFLIKNMDVGADDNDAIFLHESVIRGHHVYESLDTDNSRNSFSYH